MSVEQPASAAVLAKIGVCEVTDHPLDVGRHSAAIRAAGAGADVLFCGVVRDQDHGRHVTELEYSAYPTAAEVLRQVAAEIAAEDSVIAVAVSHRIGQLQIGDVALVAAVSTAHRAEAFQLCSRLVDEVKLRLPIWKRQVFSDGSDEWVNCP
jgi:molybdopterin synthase catalytic subunit